MKQVPVVDSNKCTRCNACIKVCPVDAVSIALNSVCAKCIKYCIELPVPCRPDYIIFDYDKCSSCGLCAELCIQGAILLTDVKTALDAREKHL